jgi:hypothetical protein
VAGVVVTDASGSAAELVLPLSVSEDGVSELASFAVRLAVEPLSPVTVTFRGRFGALTCSPAAAYFDFTNFSAPVVVTVAGVDDDVDQGDGRSDFVDFAVTSLDSLAACQAQAVEPGGIRAGRCGQAAAYGEAYDDGSLAVASLEVAVSDDDQAGLRLPASTVNATFDNFGDALSAGSFNVSLTSKPLHAVVLSFGFVTGGGSLGGAFAAVTPATVTVEPSAWRVPVLVAVRAGAPTLDRPVCGASRSPRFCGALSSSSSGGGAQRREVVATAAASEDPRYDSTVSDVGGVDVALAAVPTVAVAVRVVRDTLDPPRVEGARFANLLNALTVTFDRPTTRAAKSGFFPCADLFTGAEAERLLGLNGQGSNCGWASDSELKVTFGKGASVVPGDVLALRDGLVQARCLDTANAAAENCRVSLFGTNMTFAVGQPATPTVPSVALAASSVGVGLCDDLSLDGSSSTGSGGRPMAYNFSVVQVSGGRVANVSEALGLANNGNKGLGSFKALVPSGAMAPGSIFRVALKATNFLGYANVATLAITKLGAPAPTISVQVRGTVETESVMGVVRSEEWTVVCSPVPV